MRRRSAALGRALALCLAAAPLCCLPARGADLSISIDTGDDGWLRPRTPVRITLSRRPAPEEGRVAVLVGATDVTDLFRHDGRTLTYRPDLLPLPAGEHELRIFLVEPDGEWSEMARDTLSVLTRHGFREADVTPRLDLQGNGRLDAGDRSSGQQETFQKANVQGDLRGRWVREAWRVESRFNVLGVSDREDSLRFAKDGEDAPLVDLSSYRVEVARGDGRLALGHVSYGDNPYLVDAFASRGLTAALPVGRRARFGLAALHGTSIVGWDDVLGFEDRHHRIVAGRLGVELLPTRPGALGLGLTYLDGSLLPRSGFNSNDVNDRETSRGWGVTLQGSTRSGRIEIDAAWATSAFENPADPFLAQGADLVPVEEEERQAWSGRLSVGLLRRTIGASAVDLSLALHRQRIEPQYRSTAAFVQADREVSGTDLTLSAGPVLAQVGYAETEDDLDDVPSILGTVTRQTSANLAVPLGASGGSGAGWRHWLPTLGYRYLRTHQEGEDLPVNGGFSPGHVPDQVSTSHGATLDWSAARWTLGYRFDLSRQDNRQLGREAADFENRIHAGSLSVTAHSRLDLGLEISRERAWRGETGEIEHTDRYGPSLLWRPLDRLTLDARYSFTETSDASRAAESESGVLDVQAAYGLDWATLERLGLSGRVFVRYSENDFTSTDRVFGVDVDRGSHTLDAGLNLSFQR